MKFLALYLFSSTFAIQAYTPKTITLECIKYCDPTQVISDFLKSGHVFSSKDVEFTVKLKGNIIQNIKYADFLEYYWIPDNGYPKDLNAATFSTSHEVLPNKQEITPMDGALDCRYDNDYSCKDWREHPLAGDVITEIQTIIDTSEIKITVDQAWIDGNNTAMRKAIAYSTAIPIGRFAAFLAKFTQLTIQELALTAVVSTELSDAITGTDWYKTDLKVGDILVFNKGNMTIIRKNGTTENIGNGYNKGASGNTGSGAGSTGDSSGGSNNGGSYGGGGICRTKGTVTTGGGVSHYEKVHPCSNKP